MAKMRLEPVTSQPTLSPVQLANLSGLAAQDAISTAINSAAVQVAKENNISLPQASLIVQSEVNQSFQQPDYVPNIPASLVPSLDAYKASLNAQDLAQKVVANQAAANVTGTTPSTDTLATLGGTGTVNEGGVTLTNVDTKPISTLDTKPISTLDTKPISTLDTKPVDALTTSPVTGLANPPATNTPSTTSIPVFGSVKDAADYLKANPNTTSVTVGGFPMDAQSAIRLAQYQAAGNTGNTVDLINQLVKDNAAKGATTGGTVGTGTVVDTKPTTSIGALGTAPITTLSTSSIGALDTKPISTLDTKPISTLPTVGTQALTTADLATWGKTLPQGITADQLTSALKTQEDTLNKSYANALAGNQTALTSQNANFLKDWNTSADALKTNILSGVDTKNQAFGTQATQGFMDAFKNFQIPTNQQTGVNLGNYNDNRNAAADQWWSQYVTGRR